MSASIANVAAEPVAAAPSVTQNYPELPLLDRSVSPSFTTADLSPQQRLALASLVGGQTLAAAAARAGVCRKTLYNWRREASFNNALSELGREAMEAAAARARIILLKATRAISSELDAKRAFPAAMRVVSCRRLWDAGKEYPADLTADESLAEHGAPSAAK